MNSKQVHHRKDEPPELWLFMGSSSIARWKSLAQDFPEVRTLNAGQDGKSLREILPQGREEIVRHRPNRLFLYAGSIDLRRGDSPAQVLHNFKQFCQSIHQQSPETDIYYLAAKPSLAKWATIERDQSLNALIAEFVSTVDGVHFIDLWTAMLQEGCPPPERLFVSDRNHLSEEGYAIWVQAIRASLVAVLNIKVTR